MFGFSLQLANFTVKVAPKMNPSKKSARPAPSTDSASNKEQPCKRRNSLGTPTPVQVDNERSRGSRDRDKIMGLAEMCNDGVKINGRYVVQGKLGSGSFGVVLEVKDESRNDSLLAMKITKRDDCIESSIRESQMLYFLNGRDGSDKHHIVRLFCSFSWMERHFVALEHLSMCLWYYLYRHDRHDQRYGLDMQGTQIVTFQLLEALCFLGDHRVVHGDLKPNNIMLKNVETLEIKLIDFGSANQESNLAKGMYFQTRCYRAPEVLFGMHLSTALDMWSVGCLMAEFHIGKPLFLGEFQNDQVNKIIETLGMPPTYLLAHANYTNSYFAKVSMIGHSSYVRRHVPGKDYGLPASKPLAKILKGKSSVDNANISIGACAQFEKLLLNMLGKILDYDPAKRITPYAAKEHKFFQWQPDKKSNVAEQSLSNDSKSPK